jgi:hypothetical protein
MMTIEEQLLSKYARSQAKIQSIRLKQHRREAESLQPVPRINKTSKEIVELLEGKADNSTSGYASQIVSSCRSSLGFTMHPKHSFISLAALDEEISENHVSQLKRKAFHCKSASQSQGSLATTVLAGKVKANVRTRQESGEIRRATLEDLKNAVKFRENAQETEELGVKLYEMTVLERNDYWIKKKQEKMKEKVEKKMFHEIEDCTFTPCLAPKVNLNLTSRPSSQNSHSYTQRHLKKLTGIPPPSKQGKKVTSKPPSCPTNPLIYKALSPHCKTIHPSASLSLLKNAVPMISYKTSK